MGPSVKDEEVQKWTMSLCYIDREMRIGDQASRITFSLTVIT